MRRVKQNGQPSPAYRTPSGVVVALSPKDQVMEAKISYMGHAFGVAINEEVLGRMKQQARGTLDLTASTKLRISPDGLEFGTKAGFLSRIPFRSHPISAVLDLFLDSKRPTVLYALIQHAVDRFELVAFKSSDREPQLSSILVQRFREFKQLSLTAPAAPVTDVNENQLVQHVPDARHAAARTPAAATASASTAPTQQRRNSPRRTHDQVSPQSLHPSFNSYEPEAPHIASDQLSITSHGLPPRTTVYRNASDRASVRTQSSIQEDVQVLTNEIRDLRRQFESYVGVSTGRYFADDVFDGRGSGDERTRVVTETPDFRELRPTTNGRVSIDVPDYREAAGVTLQLQRSAAPAQGPVPVLVLRVRAPRPADDDDRDGEPLVLRADTGRIVYDTDGRDYDEWRRFQQMKAVEIRQQAQQSRALAQQPPGQLVKLIPVKTVPVVRTTRTATAHQPSTVVLEPRPASALGVNHRASRYSPTNAPSTPAPQPRGRSSTSNLYLLDRSLVPRRVPSTRSRSSVDLY